MDECERLAVKAPSALCLTDPGVTIPRLGIRDYSYVDNHFPNHLKCKALEPELLPRPLYAILLAKIAKFLGGNDPCGGRYFC